MADQLGGNPLWNLNPVISPFPDMFQGQQPPSNPQEMAQASVPQTPPGFSPGPGLSEDAFKKWLAATGIVPTDANSLDQQWQAYKANPSGWTLSTSGSVMGTAAGGGGLADIASLIGGGGVAGIAALAAAAKSGTKGAPGDKPKDPAPQSTATTLNPDYNSSSPYSLANLQNYGNWMQSQLNNANKLLMGDLSTFGSTISNIMNAPGGDFGVGGMLKTQLAAQAPIYAQMLNDSYQKMLTQPYVDMINQQVSNAQNIGAKGLAESATIQNLIQYASQIPGYFSQLGIQGGTPAAGATTSTNTAGLGGLLNGISTLGVNNLPISQAPAGSNG